MRATHSDDAMLPAAESDSLANTNVGFLSETIASESAQEAEVVEPAPSSSVLEAPVKMGEPRIHKWALKHFESAMKESPALAERMKMDPAQGSAMDQLAAAKDDIPLAGKIFAWMGFGLIALSFSLFIYSFFYKPQGGGWGDLALLVSIILYSWLALAFALIAQIIFWASGSVTPWYQWPALTLGVLLTLAFVVGKIKG
ncbi:MAG: hypothetical protein ACKO66_03455 [Flavobacteriales bacterium]